MIESIVTIFTLGLISAIAGYVIYIVFYVLFQRYNIGKSKPSGKEQLLRVGERARIRMLESVIHEVGNCATSLLPTIQNIELLLRQNHQLDERTNDDFRLVCDQLNRLIETKQDASIFSQLAGDESQFVNVNESVRSCYRLLRFDSRANGVKFELELSASLPMLNMSAASLTSILTNLIINALDALKEQENDAKITIETYLANERIAIIIDDNGCGMNEETLEKATQPYFTTKQAGKGTGLGLHVINHVVSEAHGNLTIESQENVGTSISIHFPLPQETGD